MGRSIFPPANPRSVHRFAEELPLASESPAPPCPRRRNQGPARATRTARGSRAARAVRTLRAVARAAPAAQRTLRRAHTVVLPPCATQTAFTQSESVPAGGQVIQPQRPSICAIQRVPPKPPDLRICCKQGQPAYLRLSLHPPLPACRRRRCRCGQRRRRSSSSASTQSLILLCSPYPTHLPPPLGASHSHSCMSVQHRRPWAKSHCLSLPPCLPPAPLRPSSAGPRRSRPPPLASAGLTLLRRPAPPAASPSSAGLHRPAPVSAGLARAGALVPAS